MRTNYNTINKLLDNPSEISEVISNPGKYGVDFWNELSNKHKSYIAFAAAACLVMYGIYLNRQEEEPMLEKDSIKGELQ
ncbi:hypothetical protein ACSX1A_05525 [Pontibacter sp. MBLB2868]|uniref:hypothetical protein n=1 Tax=Pontibacter sp. MBLB2868 TaxID=3451555 RepID=UPI003F75601B